MPRRPSNWLALSIMLLVAAASFWRLGQGRAARKGEAWDSPKAALSAGFEAGEVKKESGRSVEARRLGAAPGSLRLTNTSLPIGKLVRDTHAILLQNAWLDTSPVARTGQGNPAGIKAGRLVAVPGHLRAAGDPGAYVVQSRALPDDAFRALLSAAGGSIVSYIPNNAYLVRVSAAGAQQLSADPHTQVVLPYEPYYKLDPGLLGLAVAQAPLPSASTLNVLLFPDAPAAAREQLESLGLQVLSEERSPFGPVLKVQAAATTAAQALGSGPADILPALARLPAVQHIEAAHARVLASDLSRARIGVAANTVAPDNYLGLTGTNVLVNVNDSGVDASHPDLTNRVSSDFAISSTDTNGHGTHVAGIIAGSGVQSATVSDAAGSIMPPAPFQFRGMAPAARLFATAADPNAGPASSDAYLQQTAARTNALISNNSWHYGNDTAYDLAAASYDAAVRDALPEETGPQPLVFVFGAGNAGDGANDGTGGSPDSIQSPATAKNVITVGAIEQPRGITNRVWQCSIVDGTNVCQTNQPWFGETDSSNQVAAFSSRGNVGIGIEGQFGRMKPDVVAPGTFVVAARSTQWDQDAYYFPTNDSDYFQVLSNLNECVGPFYRYESGTSMAAAEVSGVLALMEEFFQRLSMTNSPALMKALLINGARNLAAGYSFQPNAGTNLQGWGLINLTNTLPGALTNLDATASPMLLFDQSPANALATGQSNTRYVSVSSQATNQPLRVTLVWTDPPGNPAAGVKLVNDLDLVVTNLDTGEVFLGNDFPAGGSFSVAWDTNTAPNVDVVNNIENVFLAPPLGTNYSVTVLGRSVNVNAVSAQSTNVAQDYALVISSGDGGLTNALMVTDAPVGAVSSPQVTLITNTFGPAQPISGALLLGQRAGANAPLAQTGYIPWPGGSNGLIAPGTLSQWRFYVLTNDEGYSNAAFVTFDPATLALPPPSVSQSNLSAGAALAADVDLYVSTNPALTSLDPAALAQADKSLHRSGTQMLVYSNAAAGPYYVGVQAEDGQAAEFSFMGVFSLLPFSTQNPDGSWVLQGINVPAVIPDGTAARPGVTSVVALASAPVPVRRVVVTNEIWHESFSDLVGTLSHGRVSAVLLSNSVPPVIPVPYDYTYVFEDNGEGDIPGSQPSDGPGSLRSFIGQQGAGLWLLTMADEVPTHTGLVANVSIRLDPQYVNTGLESTVQSNALLYDFFDVPTGATNLTVCVNNDSAISMPMNLYVRAGSPPTTTAWDQMAVVNDIGGCVSVNGSSLPPISAGCYYIGVFNPGSVPQTIRINAQVQLNTNIEPAVSYAAAGPVPISDDAVTYAGLFVTNTQPIASVAVQLHLDHPRVSDLAITLISPDGTPVSLFQNRGGATTNGLGGTVMLTNIFPTRSSGDYNANTNVLGVGHNQGTLFMSYDMY
ncbi:MAG TPA: S8 family serine peptidase, partial [Candidatus Acidoferrum sp.]|nr:S8 family serine peptidase [Candidatus Acidoferrum sp.]